MSTRMSTSADSPGLRVSRGVPMVLGATLALAGVCVAQGEPPLLTWYTAYNWKPGAEEKPINTLNVGLIPTGSYRGCIAILSADPTPPAGPAGAKFFILCPEKSQNALTGLDPTAFVVPPTATGAQGDEFRQLACCGTGWTVDGR